MKIKTTDKCKTVNNVPVKPDSVVEVDENTARNLIKKGFAVAHDAEAKEVDLQDPSRISPEQADAQVEGQVAAREEKKAKDDAAKDKAKKKGR